MTVVMEGRTGERIGEDKENNMIITLLVGTSRVFYIPTSHPEGETEGFDSRDLKYVECFYNFFGKDGLNMCQILRLQSLEALSLRMTITPVIPE